MEEELLTVEQAARELGMHPAAVRKAILGGRLHGRKLSARVIVLARAEVERYKRERPRPGPRPRTSPTPLEDKEHQG